MIGSNIKPLPDEGEEHGRGDIWSAMASERASTATEAEEAPVGSEESNSVPDDESVVDAKERPVKKKKTALVVISLVAVIFTGGFGTMGWTLYRKMNPDRTPQDTGSPMLIRAISNVDPSTVVSGAFPAPGGAKGGSVLIGSAEAATPQGAVISPAAPIATVAPIKELVDTAPAITAPVVAQPKPVAAVVEEKPISVVPKAAAVKVKAATLHSSVEKPQRKASATADKRRPVEPKTPLTSETVEKGLGVLSQYRVVAFEPKHGAFQQAWVRSSEGKISIVRAGDDLNGLSVIEISASAGRVKTNKGDIR